MRSAYQESLYEVGEFKHSDRETPSLQPYEIKGGAVNHGIHVFVDRDNAERCLARICAFTSYEIYETLCPKEAFVTQGWWDCHPYFPQAVFDKVKLLKKVKYDIKDYPYLEADTKNMSKALRYYLLENGLTGQSFYPANKIFESKKLER